MEPRAAHRRHRIPYGVRCGTGERLTASPATAAPGFQRGEYFCKTAQSCGRYSKNGKFQIVRGIVVIDVHIRIQRRKIRCCLRQYFYWLIRIG